MTPATSAGAKPEARTRRPARWTRAEIIDAIREWTALYGEPPRAADWNPGSARWSGATWRIARYRKGRPDGTPWPSLNRAKAPFGGSLTAALAAAGFEPNKPGPKTRRDVTSNLRERVERASATHGERRALRTGIDVTRNDAVAGPEALGKALRALVAARKTNNPQLISRALADLVSAAVTWQERL